MNFFIFVFISLLSIASFSQQFKEGNQFFSTPIYGRVNITCRDMGTGETQHAIYTCNDLRLSPVEYDFFIGPSSIKADSVTITAIQQNGKKVEKSSKYSSYQSTTRMNLWIRSLLQTPLLSDGINKISYKLSFENKVVSEGQFEVTVTRAETRQCPNGSINSNIMSDCNSPYSACQRYFNEYNYCF